MRHLFLSLLFCCLLGGLLVAQSNQDQAFIQANYSKQEVRIAMRDGVSLFTSIYTPKDTSQAYPIMYIRTPYRVAPYGPDQYPSRLGPSPLFMREKFIFVYQDVRGRFMSEGEFEDMRPQVPGSNEDKKKQIDESTDTWDTIDWLMDSLRHHNERVGMWGISYPGFYTAAGVINSHPKLVAASPQAPIADWWFDDFHHHGAFFLPHCFNFIYSFGQPRRELTTEWPPRINHGTPDGYDFFLNRLGPLSNAKKDWMGDSIKFWNDLTAHPNYDGFWQARNLLPHLKNVNCAVLTVGGWYDAEDLYGPLNIYQSIEKNNPNTSNALVMGPWRHGGWSRGDGSSLGNVYFGETPAPSLFYQNQIEFPFFMQHLKGLDYPELPEAYLFETGTNQWRSFAHWPPRELEKQTFYFHEKGRLSREAPKNPISYDEFVSDPDKPVPSHEDITTGMPRSYMTADQRFAARRPDVLVYETEVLSEDLTLAGPLLATLKVSTDQADADWVVKLIDVYPDDHPPYPHQPDKKMGGYQQMVRSEAIRGRFRNSYEQPEPFAPGKVETIRLPLQDVLHTFKKGHRIMIQVQSTWFPIIDRNPQKWVDNIYKATAEDFVKATHRLYHQAEAASKIEVGVEAGSE